MPDSKESINLLGAVIANVNNVLLIGIFLARIYKYEKLEYWLGLLFIASIIPLIFIFIKSFELKRNLLYHVQLMLMIGFLILELVLDYILKVDFRQNRAILIPYITLFYASIGGMIGVAAQGGRAWGITTIITFLIVTAFSLFAHFKAGS